MRSVNVTNSVRAAFAGLFISACLALAPAQAVEPDSDWDAVVEEARGQTVYFNAWGGSDRINEYLQWSADSLLPRPSVGMRTVMLTLCG